MFQINFLIHPHNIKNKKRLIFERYIKDYENLNIKITIWQLSLSQIRILYRAKHYLYAYLIFENYEKILNWNRL